MNKLLEKIVAEIKIHADRAYAKSLNHKDDSNSERNWKEYNAGKAKGLYDSLDIINAEIAIADMMTEMKAE